MTGLVVEPGQEKIAWQLECIFYAEGLKVLRRIEQRFGARFETQEGLVGWAAIQVVFQRGGYSLSHFTLPNRVG